MPYSLVYVTGAVIPVKIGEPSLRYCNESGPSNDESRLQDLDEVEQRRDMAHVRMVDQKQQVEKYYNKKAKVRPLKVGDYILKAKTQAAKVPNEGKLGTNWDGPYKITATANKGAFQLETMEGKLLQTIGMSSISNTSTSERRRYLSRTLFPSSGFCPNRVFSVRF
ncbi:uncharacterized protein [Nicotiana sylvestris]|uniref:uncharacterized protein n=1 Tax=Nicotiana sylvestris TaxID=4096 RepID=UPI00388C65FB